VQLIQCCESLISSYLGRVNLIAKQVMVMRELKYVRKSSYS
jgi:hypothetical protein